MYLPLVLCAALASTAFGNDAANRLMDKVLSDMAFEIRNTGLDPLELDSMLMKLKGDGPYFEANITQGSLNGLQKIRRHGSCSLEPHDSEISVHCYLSIAPLRFLMDVDVYKRKDDGSGREVNRISTSTRHGTWVTSNYILRVELNGAPNSAASLNALEIPPFKMVTTIVKGDIGIRSRLSTFLSEVNGVLAEELKSRLHEYSRLLDRVARRFRMP